LRAGGRFHRLNHDAVWTMGWPFWARRRLRGFRLSATDIECEFGAGRVLEAPIATLLLRLAGRP